MSKEQKINDIKDEKKSKKGIRENPFDKLIKALLEIPPKEKGKQKRKQSKKKKT